MGTNLIISSSHRSPSPHQASNSTTHQPPPHLGNHASRQPPLYHETSGRPPSSRLIIEAQSPPSSHTRQYGEGNSQRHGMTTAPKPHRITSTTPANRSKQHRRLPVPRHDERGE